MRIRFAVVAACFPTLLAVAIAETIPANEAAKQIGERATVCGMIGSERTASSSRGTPTFIDLDKPYPNQVFTVLVWGDQQTAVGKLPE